MTLDEAIKHEEKVVEANENTARICHMQDAMIQEENDCIKYAEKHRQLAEWLKELKQLREQTQWIPVSERLPKIADVYRVTRYFPNNIMNPRYMVDACFFDGSNTWHSDNRINHARAYVNNVIAWQENPEPYDVESKVKQIINNDLFGIAEHYGLRVQMRQLIEEMAELTQVICKSERYDFETVRDHLVEELADVDVVLTQVKYLLGLDDSEFDKIKDEKIKRQIQRITKGENNK